MIYLWKIHPKNIKKRRASEQQCHQCIFRQGQKPLGGAEQWNQLHCIQLSHQIHHAQQRKRVSWFFYQDIQQQALHWLFWWMLCGRAFTPEQRPELSQVKLQPGRQQFRTSLAPWRGEPAPADGAQQRMFRYHWQSGKIDQQGCGMDLSPYQPCSTCAKHPDRNLFRIENVVFRQWAIQRQGQFGRALRIIAFPDLRQRGKYLGFTSLQGNLQNQHQYWWKKIQQQTFYWKGWTSLQAGQPCF